MAQEAVNAVVQAFQRGMEQVQARNARAEELKLQQQREDAEEKFRQQQLDQQQKQFDAQQKANEALFNLHRSAQEYAQAGQAQQTGQTPPGWQTLPGIQPTSDQPLVLSGLQNTQYVPPSGNVISSPPLSQSPLIQYQEQKAREAEASKIRETQAAQAAETQRQLEIAERTEAARMREINLQKQWDDDRARMVINGENARADNANANHLRIAMASATGGLSEMLRNNGMGGGGLSITSDQDGIPQFNRANAPAMIKNGLDSLYSGDMSLEQLEKVNPKMKQMIASYASLSNTGALQTNEVKEMQDLQQMVNVAGRLRELHEIRQKGVLADWQSFNAKEASLIKDMPGIINSLNNVKRVNTLELQNEIKGLIPSRVPILSSAKTEGEKYNDFISRNILQKAKDIVQSIPDPKQQDAILTRYGMGKLQRLNLNQPKTIQYIRDSKTNQLVPVGGQ